MSWRDTVDWNKIPERMRGGITRYIEDGVAPGRFLRAIFCNDLGDAVASADDENVALLQRYVTFLYNECPRSSWGGLSQYQLWIGHAGLKGAKPGEAVR